MKCKNVSNLLKILSKVIDMNEISSLMILY